MDRVLKSPYADLLREMNPVGVSYYHSRTDTCTLVHFLSFTFKPNQLKHLQIMNLLATVNEPQSHLNHCVSVCLCVQSFQPPKKPFRRMRYTEALVYLKENNITKDDGSFYEFGDVSQWADTHTHTCKL